MYTEIESATQRCLESILQSRHTAGLGEDEQTAIMGEAHFTLALNVALIYFNTHYVTCTIPLAYMLRSSIRANLRICLSEGNGEEGRGLILRFRVCVDQKQKYTSKRGRKPRKWHRV